MYILAVSGESLPIIGILYIIGIALLTYFLLIKPSKKRKTEFEEMLGNLKVGDEVITKSGVVGKIVELDDLYFTIETADSTKIKFILNGLSYIVTPAEEDINKMTSDDQYNKAEDEETEDNLDN